MLIGRASVGKSTFINTLCDKKALPVDVSDSTNDGRAMRLVPHHVEMLDGEDNVVINLDIIESSGFGDMLNNEDW
jgi:septin family protein